MVVSCCANVALTVWGPGYGVHLSCVALEGPHGLHGIPEIEDHHIVAVLLNGGQLVDVSLVPCDSEQWLLVRALVNDGAVLEVSQVKVPHRAVFTRRCKQILIPEANVVNGGVVCNQLRLHAPCLYVPDGAGRVDGARPYHRGHVRVPVKARYRRAVV